MIDATAGPRGRPLHVAYALTEFPALTETFVTTECTLLEGRGVHVLPFSLRRSAHDALIVADPLGGASGWHRRTGYAGVAWPGAFGGAAARRALAIVKDHLRLAPSEGAWAARALPAAAWIAERATEADHIHTHFERGAAILASLVAALLDRPWSFTAHAFGVYLSSPRALAYRCRRAAFVRVSHAALGARLRALPGTAGASFVLARTPLLSVRGRHGSSPSSPSSVVVVARDVPKKGLDLLPAIATALAGLGHTPNIDVIGPSSRRRPTWATGTIRHLGPRPHSEIQRRLEAAWLTLLPCRVAPNGDRDGLPLSLLESMAAHTPAVSTRVGGIAEAYPGELASLLAAPEDVLGLARAMAGVLCSPERRSHLAALGAEVVARDYGERALDPLLTAFAGARPAPP